MCLFHSVFELWGPHSMPSDELRKRLLRFLEERDLDAIEDYIAELLSADSPVRVSDQSPVEVQSPPDVSQSHRVKESYLGEDTPTEDVQFDTFFTSTGSSPIPSTPEPPPVIANYVVAGELGIGGMSTVWDVEDERLRRSVALKLINSNLSQQTDERATFIEEAQITAQLQHPGIVPVYELGRLTNGRPYFTMQQVQGRNLGAVLGSVHQVSVDTWRSTDDGWDFRGLISVFHKVCQTIEYAHSRGVVHCDLKPANIMVGDYGEVLVVDWGIAVVQAEVNHRNTILTDHTKWRSTATRTSITGTPAYMAPEQAVQGSKIDHRSDIYALGSMLYHILRGIPPFTGDVLSIIAEKCSNSPVSVRTAATPESTALPLPDELVFACEKAMARIPSQRFQSTSELTEAIYGWLEGVQRREKAQQILTRVSELESLCIEQKERQRLLYLTAQSALESDLENLEGWQNWTDSLDCIADIGQLMLEIEQLLQGALIYDSQLTIIHEKLAEIEYNHYLDAVQRHDHSSKQRYLRRFKTYCDVLDAEHQARWDARRIKDDSSFAFVQRKRGKFIGRASAVEESLELLTKKQVLCIVGTAGVGKTHLALEVGSRRRELSNQAIFFCDLSNVRDELGLLQVIGQTLLLDLKSAIPEQEIFEYLRCHSSLLILDNAEHIVAIVSRFLTRLGGQVPDICVIVTSRTTLKQTACATFKVVPMSLLEGLELFVSRAQKVKPNFVLTESNRIGLAQLVTQLDCLPLAIELAAARVTMFTAEQITQRLAQRFDLLRGRVRDQEQPALQTALDWSWGLLTAAGQSVLMQCSCFRGGFDLSAAEAVIDLSDIVDTTPIADLIEALYDDNLLLKHRQENGDYRYGMLASIHEYAQQQLSDHVAGFNIEELKRQHAGYFGHRYEQGKEVDPLGLGQVLLRELDNFIEALMYGPPAESLLCCTAALTFFQMNGPMIRGVELSEQYLQRSDLSEDQRFPILLHRSTLLRMTGDIDQANLEMTHILELASNGFPSEPLSAVPNNGTEERKADKVSPFEDIEFSDESVTIEERFLWLLNKGTEAGLESHFPFAERCFLKALSLAEQVGDVALRIEVYKQLGMNCLHRGRLESITYLTAAIDHFEHALKLAQVQNNRALEVRIMGTLGCVLGSIGQHDKSIQTLSTALFRARQLSDTSAEHLFGAALGISHQRLGEYEHAIDVNMAMSEAAKSVGDDFAARGYLYTLGMVYIREGEFHKAIGVLSSVIDLALPDDVSTLIIDCQAQIGYCYVCLSEYEQGIEFYQRAISAAKARGKQYQVAVNNGKLADALIALGRLEEAKEVLNNAIEQTHDVFSHLANLFRIILARLLARDENLDEAKDLLEQVVPNDDNCLFNQYRFYCFQAETQLLVGRVNESRLSLDQAISIVQHLFKFERTKSESIIAPIQERLSNVSVSYNSQGHLHVSMLLHQAKLKEQASDYSEALNRATQALQASRHQSDIRLQALSLHRIGTIHRKQRKYSKSIDSFKESVQLSRQINDPDLLSISLSGLGTVSVYTPAIRDGVEFLKEAVQLSTSLGNLQQLGGNLGSLGMGLLKLNELKEAEECYRRAIEIARELGDRQNLSAFLGSFGALQRIKGDFEESIDTTQEAIQITNKLGNKQTESLFRGNLGNTYSDLGRNESAIACYQEAVMLARSLEIPNTESRYLGNLASVYCKEGQYLLASEHYTQAIRIAIDQEDVLLEAIHGGNYGDLLLKQQQFLAAEERYRRSISLSDTTMPLVAGVFQGSLALLLARTNRTEEAFEHLTLGESKVEQDPTELSKFLCKKAEVYHLSHRPKDALDTFERVSILIDKLMLPAHSEPEMALDALCVALENDSSVASIDAVKLLSCGRLERELTNYDRSLELLSSAYELFQSLSDINSEAEVLYEMGRVYFECKRYVQAQEHFHRALAKASTLMNKEFESRILGALGQTSFTVGEFTEASAYAHRAINSARAMGNRSFETVQLGHLAKSHENIGAFKEALDCCEQASEIARQLGLRTLEGRLLCDQASLLISMGENHRAIEIGNAVLERSRELSNVQLEIRVLNMLGTAHEILGHIGVVNAVLERKVMLSKELGEKPSGH